MSKFYITTAIAYTSRKPHIGNTYEIVLTDAIARYKRTQAIAIISGVPITTSKFSPFARASFIELIRAATPVVFKKFNIASNTLSPFQILS